MSEFLDGPLPYRVSYSERVRAALKQLIAHARQRGLARDVLDAIKEIDRRLKLYPQFGQPLRDLSLRPLQIWVGVVPPLVVQYVLDEESRQVMVGIPILSLPRSGL